MERGLSHGGGCGKNDCGFSGNTVGASNVGTGIRVCMPAQASVVEGLWLRARATLFS